MSDPEPFEATRLPTLDPHPSRDKVIRDVMTAISGFPHPGAHADALILTVRWLTAHPERIRDLFPDAPIYT